MAEVGSSAHLGLASPGQAHMAVSGCGCGLAACTCAGLAAPPPLLHHPPLPRHPPPLPVLVHTPSPHEFLASAGNIQV